MNLLKSKSGLVLIALIVSASLRTVCSAPVFADPAVTVITVLPATGTYGSTVSLSATLTSSGSGVSGKSIVFTLSGITAGTAITNGSGVASLSNASLSGVSAGTHDAGISASFAGDAGYTASSGTALLTVERATLTVSGLAINNKVYDGTTTATLNTTGVTLEGRVAGDSVSLTGTAVFDSKDVGSGKTVAVTGLALTGSAAGNYTLSSTTATLSANITAKALTVTAEAKTKVYRAADPAWTYTISSGSLVGGDAMTGALTRAAGENAGAYAIQQGTLTAGNNYALNFVPANLTITRVALTVSGITASDKEYDGTTSATVNASSAVLEGIMEGDAVTLNTAGATGTFANKNVGAGKTISVSGLALSGASAGNYTITAPTTTASITRRELTVTADVKSKVYGAALPTFTARATGLGSGDTLASLNLGYTLGTTATTTSPPGSYTITFAGGASLATNYGPITYIDGTLSVTTSSLTVTGITVTSKVYDGTTAAVLGGTGRLVGVVGGDDVALSGTAMGTYADKNVGTGKTVAISGLALAGMDVDNYTLTQPAISGNITAKPITVTAEAKTKPYGAPEPTLTYSLAAGALAGTDTLSGELTRTAGDGVGTYAIAQGTLAASSNYTITYVAANLTVTKAATTLRLDSSLNPAIFGQPVTFSATIEVTSPGAGTPTGTVQFAVDGANFGSAVSLVSGVAVSTSTSTLSATNHIITATYNGDTSFNTSNDTLDGGQVINSNGAIASYFVAVIRSPQTAGVPFTVTIQARDAYGNTVASGAGSSEYVTMRSGLGDEGALPEGVTTAGGTANLSVTLAAAQKTQTLIFTGAISGVSGTSNGFTVNAPSTPAANRTTTPTPTSTASRSDSALVPAPTSTPIIKNVTSSLNAQGAFGQPLTLSSADAWARLDIATATLAKTADNQPLTQITTAAIANPPPAPASCYMVGGVYDFGPEGTTFSIPVSVSLAYFLNSLPTGFSENDLRVVTYDKSAGQWAFLTSSVDTSGRTVTGKIAHFSYFTLMTTRLNLPILGITDFQVTPSPVTAGQNVTIQATINNTGDLAGVYNLLLKVNGALSETRSITISAKSSEKVTLATTKDTAGEYAIDLNGMTGKFTVTKAPAAGASTTPAKPGSSTTTAPTAPAAKTAPAAVSPLANMLSGFRLWLMVGAAVVIVAALFLLRMVRRKSNKPVET